MADANDNGEERSVAYQRASDRLEATDRVAREIITRDKQALDAKTARLRQLRLEAKPDELSWMDKNLRR